MIAVLAAFAFVTYAPGSANFAVSLGAMGQGTRDAVGMALGLALGLAVWGLAATLGLGAAFAASEAAMSVLRLLGGGYLLWLAWSGLRGARRSDVAREPVAWPFRAGLVLHLANPKAVLALLAALAMGLDGQAGAGMVAVATAACAAMGLSNFLFRALLMSRGLARRTYLRARRRIEAGTATLGGLSGAELIREGMAR